MTTAQLIVRSLRFHFRAHLGVVLGAAIGTAALVGALLVGDSVRISLRALALSRLGQIETALAPRDRLFRDDLSEHLAAELKRPAAAVLQLPAIAIRSDGATRANDVQVLGVTKKFWTLAPRRLPAADSDSSGVVVNQTLARQLNVRIGDEILLRVQKPSRLSRDAPISPQQDFNVALRLPISAIVTEEQLGRFSLQANQLPPFNAFVPLALLQQRTEATNRANLLLIGQGETSLPPLAEMQRALARVWQLADAGLKLVALTNVPGFELRSDQVFLDPAVIAAAQRAAPKAEGVLTYFVNELRVGERSTPYSMVAGLEKPTIPSAMNDDEILLSAWLIDDLQATPGQEIELKYYTVGASRQLEVTSRRFRIRGNAPAGSIYSDPQLMPEFPGVAEAESSQEWDAGFPIDLKLIREKDEDYWKKQRGTPKAFVTLNAAQQMWTNRFGILTGLRFPPVGATPEAVGRALLENLSPAAVGLTFQPVRAQALAASAEALPFGQLFLGFSFFLIVAALVLMALLFQFGLEQRMAEVGTLLAVGFKPAQVRRLFLLEGVVLAFVGTLIGLAGAIFYARAMLYGLATIWSGAVGSATLNYHSSPLSLGIGLVSALMVATLTIALVLRKLGRRPARDLLDQAAEEPNPNPGQVRLSLTIAAISGVIAVALTSWCLFQGDDAAPGLFFGAGALALIAGLSFMAALLS
ncbi:MAG TPA: ABC transporter permease, partial [Verrucomicrobiae bacterium]|nr:ABC transporter permease [Verrucomicrobiae bacterium]